MSKSLKTPAKKSKKTATSSRGEQDQIGAVNTRIADYLGVSEPDLFAALNILECLRFRDSIYQKFGINRFESWALRSLHGYLTMHNRVIVSQDVILDHLSGNYKQRAKFYGYFQGLMRAGCLGTFEYVKHPGTLSIGITDLGFQIIRAYYDEMNVLFSRFVKLPRTTDKHLSISVAENVPTYYRKTG